MPALLQPTASQEAVAPQDPFSQGPSGTVSMPVPEVPEPDFPASADEGGDSAPDGAPDAERGASPAERPQAARLPSRGVSRFKGSAGSLVDEEEDEEESSLPRGQKCCAACRNHCGKGKGGSCYWCYVIVFFLFCWEFPVFLVWMVRSPVPDQFWNEDYGKFPVLEDHEFIQSNTIEQYNIFMSDIPKSYSQCNHSCSGAAGANDVSFHVDMKLDAPDFKHTAFPVLLASNDFENWWVASDKRDAHPVPFFPSHSAKDAAVYQHLTPECTRVPELETTSTAGTTVPPTELFSSAPTYVMACVAWDADKVEYLDQSDTIEGDDLQTLGMNCNAVGGVCGWSCGSAPTSAGDLPGCRNGVLEVNSEAGSIAGINVPNASFKGNVDLKACMSDPGSKECVTSTLQMIGWPCHTCRRTEFEQVQEDSVREVYTDYHSLPRMEVTLRNAPMANANAVPRIYIFSSSVDVDGGGPAGMLNGTWKKLYNPTAVPQPQRIELIAEQKEVAEGATSTAPPVVAERDWNTMQFIDKNKVTLKPDKCFAQRGPLYLVACAVNASLYQDKFELEIAQTVGPPPFNDRCLAVTGRCAFSCMEQSDLGMPHQHCRADGTISFEDLTSDFETPTNDGVAVTFFVIVLLIGFSVKLVTYFPGLFIPYAHPKYYDPSMTSQLKYLTVCAPSGGETKACVLRNLVGAFSGMPRKCQCPFYVVFADEGHRHPQKVMFRALVTILKHVPDVPLNQITGEKSPRRGSRHGYKEDNLKAFTKIWVEQTRLFRLEQCNTGKTAEKIKKLKANLKEGEEPTAEIKKLEKMIDDLAGVNALRTLQSRSGWPKANDGSEGGALIRDLEEALQQLRKELACGEKTFDGAGVCDKRVPMHLDDVEAHSWSSRPSDSNPNPMPLYTLHYCARAKPDEDDRILKVQHVARGVWYYKIPQLEEARNQKSWREWRKNAQEFTDADFDTKKYLVPLRTSRGKAGGLNFVENYLFDYSMNQAPSARGDALDAGRYKHALFSIADARHQFQPDFMHETVPFFFKKRKSPELDHEVDTSVAFTQCPQYYPEMPDDVDYLDTNNSNFFRLNCMLRNCCGGVSSCGTGGTWLIRDRRAGIHGTDSIWDTESIEMKRQGFTQMIEYTFFHESCKVEDTASSLDRVVKGKHSQYVNRRLAYGMAKDPVDYLAAVQRWAEGGVVLALQTFLGCEEGIHMIWMTFLLFLSFIGSLINLVYGPGYSGLVASFSEYVLGGDWFEQIMLDFATWNADWVVVGYGASDLVYKSVYVDIFMNVQGWLFAMCLFFLVLTTITQISYWAHHCACFRRKRKLRRTRFPTSLAQWARLLITMDNLTYFLWFWTAFFWVGFNYYAVYFRRYYHFEAEGMVLFSWMMQVLSWSMVISATCRYRMDQSMAANEVFFLSLTNIWRTTQMFYITAPLIAYSIIMGTSDFLKNRMLGVDISYWVGGDRGAVSKAMTQWWTLFLVVAMLVTHVLFWFTDLLVHADVVGVIIVSFIGLDVMHPCAFLWLGVEEEPLPKPPAADLPAWQRCLRRCCKLMTCGAFYRNCMRQVVFHPRTALCVQWIGPLQNVLMPILTMWMPELGINNALLLLASVK